MARRCWNYAFEKNCSPCWARTRRDRSDPQGLKAEDFEVSVTRLCRWFAVPRRTLYYRSRKSALKIKPELVEPIREMIEQESSFGYRTAAHLLGMNKNAVPRIFQLKGWQCASGPWVTGRASRRCRRLPKLPINAGRQTCVASGADATDG